MGFVKRTCGAIVIALFVTVIAAEKAPAQQIKAGEVNGRLAAAADPRAKGADVAEKGNPGPLPCDSKNNPKCDPASPSKPGETTGKGKGA